MEVLHDVGACPRPASGSVVTIGAYDGVHRGHQAVIAEVRRRASDQHLDSVVVTFDRHPASVVRPESAPRLLTDLDQKLELLAATGLDRALVISFDEARSKEPADDFVREVLVDALGARVVIVGEDFHFGHQRRGNVELLRSMGADLGFEVAGLALVDATGAAAPTGENASSTAIRHALVAGDLATAAAMRAARTRCGGSCPTATSGAVSSATRRRTCRCRATSSCPPTGSTPGGTSARTGSAHASAISLGRRPTFYEEAHASLLEAHLLDFTGDLYGEPARVQFIERLRGEQRFERVEDLVAQMGRDCALARKILG